MDLEWLYSMIFLSFSMEITLSKWVMKKKLSQTEQSKKEEEDLIK